MPTTQLQLRRGNTAQTAIFTGAVGEVTVDTQKKTLIVHDGVTSGGIEIALKSRADASYDTANAAFSASNTANTWLQSYVQTQVASVVDSAPTTLDTLNELAAALGDDANFATTIATTIGTAGSYANSAFDAANTKLSTTGGSLTGNVYSSSNIIVSSANASVTIKSNAIPFQIRTDYGTVSKYLELDSSGISVTNTGNVWTAYAGDYLTINYTDDTRTKYHTGLSGTVNLYGGMTKDETKRTFANTADATTIYASSTGNQSSPLGYQTSSGLANGELAIIQTTIIAQSHGAAGSNSFDGTKIWKYEVVARATPSGVSTETTVSQISNTGNSGSWNAQLVFNPGVSGAWVDISVTGESGKAIYWVAKTTKESLWCSFAPAGGGGGGGGGK